MGLLPGHNTKEHSLSFRAFSVAILLPTPQKRTPRLMRTVAFRENFAQLSLLNGCLGERQSIAQKGVRAIDARNPQLENDSNASKTSVRAPGLSADEREHPFV